MPQTPYELLIDIGNTFVKWGRYRLANGGRAADNCLESGHAMLDEISDLAGCGGPWRRPSAS